MGRIETYRQCKTGGCRVSPFLILTINATAILYLMKQEIKIGNWINSYSKGIFRVEKIIEQFYDESSPILDGNKIGDKMKDRIIVSKRLLNSKFKKSISYERCSEYFVSHLNKEQAIELKKAISNNLDLLNDLDHYQIPVLISIYNSELQIQNKSDLQKIALLISFIKEGRTFHEIKKEMKKLNIFHLISENFGNYRFQLFNFNEEYIEKRKVWRDAKLTKNHP